MESEPMETAADLYLLVQRVAVRLGELDGAGRLSVSSDPTTTKWRDVISAVSAARAALDVAAQALAWLDTTV